MNYSRNATDTVPSDLMAGARFMAMLVAAASAAGLNVAASARDPWPLIERIATSAHPVREDREIAARLIAERRGLRWAEPEDFDTLGRIRPR